jgi:pimeloyl-ACP methyl ester carboxylesterase
VAERDEVWTISRCGAHDAAVRNRAGARRLVATLCVLALGVPACANGAPSIDRTIAVGGGQLDVWCDGGPGPAVVFLSAIGGDDTLRPIAESIADRTDACFYFRPGDGETEPPAAPRTAAKDAADLHELLSAASIPHPVILVAHSYGGLIADVAAASHPEDVAGVLLVDASHPDQERRMSELFTPEQQAISDAEMANFPYVDFSTSLADAGTAISRFPAIPLTVITATHGFASACDQGLPCDEMQAVWLEVQDDYASLTPNARHIRVDTGHYVHQERPDVVIHEIEALLERIGTAVSSAAT